MRQADELAWPKTKGEQNSFAAGKERRPPGKTSAGPGVGLGATGFPLTLIKCQVVRAPAAVRCNGAGRQGHPAVTQAHRDPANSR
jgi:hypothetical protein